MTTARKSLKCSRGPATLVSATTPKRKFRVRAVPTTSRRGYTGRGPMAKMQIPIRFCIVLLFVWVAPVAAQTLPTAKPESVGMSSDRLSRIGAIMRNYVEKAQIPGAVTLIARKGKIVHFEAHGYKDLASSSPMTTDTIFRIASMTKPIVSVGLMMLYEEGHFRLTDPISTFLPEFKNPNVAVPVQGSDDQVKLVPAERDINFQHLLTHTAGFPRDSVAEQTLGPFRLQKDLGSPGPTLRHYVELLATIPLESHPGTKWQYGPAADVVGRLIEVISGKPLDIYLEERIFGPLGMDDTYFFVPDEKAKRRATLYSTQGEQHTLEVVPGSQHQSAPPREKRYHSAIGGLNSTAGDYFRFCQMNLNAGAYNGVRLLSPKTVQLMTADHTGDLATARFRLWGHGFGLGYRILTDLGKGALLGSVGSYGWGGSKGTYFWIDPAEEMVGVLMTQLNPYRHLMIRRQFQIVATAAIVESYEARN